MSKKKNVKSKKARTLLRGAVAAGVAIGGVDVLGDSNVVYAAEGELEQFNDAANEIVVPSYSEQTLSQEAAEALAPEQPAVVENVTTVPTEQPVQPPVSPVETPENEQVNGTIETGDVPAEPVGDADVAGPEEVGDETQAPENAGQENVTDPIQESSETNTESTESAESTVSENSESETVSTESTDESLSEDESLSVSASESLSAGIADSMNSDEQSEAAVDREMSTAERYQMLMAKSESGELTEEEDAELRSLISASASASVSHVSMIDSLSAESLSASASLSMEGSQNASASVSQSGVESASLSTSESAKVSLSTSMSMAVSTAQSEYDSLLKDYNDGEQRLERLEQLSQQIKAQEKVVEQKRQAALDRKDKNLTEAGYYEEADKLANLLIQYKMLTDAQVNNYTDVTFSDWIENKDASGKKLEGKHVVATYKDENGVVRERYFDYVTAGENGETVADRNKTTTYSWWEGWHYQSETTAYRDDATKVQYI